MGAGLNRLKCHSLRLFVYTKHTFVAKSWSMTLGREGEGILMIKPTGTSSYIKLKMLRTMLCSPYHKNWDCSQEGAHSRMEDLLLADCAAMVRLQKRDGLAS